MRIPLLALAFALFAIPSFGQQQSISFQDAHDDLGRTPWPEDFPVPTAPLRPAITRNPSFPLQVKLVLQDNHFNYFWSDFRGHGQLLAGNTLYNFRYECPDTFRQPGAFQARWAKDGKKLDVLLQKPESHRTEVCTLAILNHS